MLGNPAFQMAYAGGNPPVQGTELPRVVMNEVYARRIPPIGGMHQVDVWVELHNPLNGDTNLSENGAAKLEMWGAGGANPPYAIYRLAACALPAAGLDPSGLTPRTSTGGGPAMIAEWRNGPPYNPAPALPAPTVPYPLVGGAGWP